MAAPSTPADVVAALAAYADRVLPTIDGKSYYDLLGLAPQADLAGVRRAFYGVAAQLHPDRFHAIPDPATRDKLETIYARVCEAYRVLSSPEKRAAYDRALAAGKLRLELTGRESGGPRNPEDTLKHPEARKFFRLGMTCLGRKDYRGAIMNFTFARGFEPDGAVIAQKLAEAQAAQKGGGR